MRWFRLEWRDARLGAGHRATPLARSKIKAALWLARAAVNVMARMPGAATVRFEPERGE
jgi:hypothetical protein